MRVFDRLGDLGHHHERATETLASLPSGTLWAVAADAEYKRHSEVVSLDGILSHDGETLRYVAWSGRRVVEAPFGDIIVIRQRNAKLQLKTDVVTVKFEPFYSLAEALIHPPGFSAEITGEDPFAGLLSWIPNAAAVL